MANDVIFKSNVKTPGLQIGNYTFPATTGTLHQILEVDASGNLVFADNTASSGITAVVDDTAPQLGGNLDVNGHSIVSLSNADIVLAPNGTGTVNVSGKLITNLGTPSTSTDATTKGYVDGAISSAVGTRLSLSGGTMTGAIDMGGAFTVYGLPTPSADDQAANKKYVDDGLALKANTTDVLALAGGTMNSGANITFQGGEVLGLPNTPSVDSAATSKKYVDDGLATKIGAVSEDTAPSLGGNLTLANHAILAGTGNDVTITIDAGKSVKIGDLNIMAPESVSPVTVVAGVSYSFTFSYPDTVVSTYVDYIFISPDGSKMGTLFILCDGTQVSLTDLGTELGTPSIDFVASVSGGNVTVVGSNSATTAPSPLKITMRQMS